MSEYFSVIVKMLSQTLKIKHQAYGKAWWCLCNGMGSTSAQGNEKLTLIDGTMNCGRSSCGGFIKFSLNAI